ncbi:hypothetical protein QYE76_003519 [Lolium multiflorum]|uniref:Uncharacterized protein n=1 Tax=Lolium multiflorum TaxID=4521 RepID=A0AAD8RQH1_LOLMU|nr:hypothetical protein QYE76_003519 [Lolium multiflorum]
MYAGDKDVDLVSKDPSIKDMEKLVRKISSLSKKDAVPTSCRVVQYSGTNPLPQPLMKHFINLGTQFIGYRDTVNRLKEDLVVANKRADDLAVKLEKSEEACKKAEKDASSIEDLRKRLHEAETALSDKITQQIAREENIVARLKSQSQRFVRKMSQDFELQKHEDDRLLDALSLLEVHGDEVRRSIFDAQAAFSRLFPYFFPKTEQPNTFAALAKSFVPKEDLGLALRQENLKIGVEGTIALVAESQQSVDWAKFGATMKLKTDKWQALIRAAKPQSKKILAFLGYNPAPSSSSAKPELVFDNYTATPRPSDALHASSYSKKASVDDFTEDSSNANLSQELNDLRQQLQSAKKQSIMIMDRFRKSSEREKAALQEAKEALALRDTAVAEAA